MTPIGPWKHGSRFLHIHPKINSGYFGECVCVCVSQGQARERFSFHFMPFCNDFILNHGISCSYILGEKTQILVQGVDCRGACACGEQRTQNSLYFPLNFAVNLRLL